MESRLRIFIYVTDAWAQLSYKIGGAHNNSAPFDLNSDLLEVFSLKKTSKKKSHFGSFSPILLLIGPILLLIGGAQGTPWALSSFRLWTDESRLFCIFFVLFLLITFWRVILMQIKTQERVNFLTKHHDMIMWILRISKIARIDWFSNLTFYFRVDCSGANFLNQV